MTANGHFLLAAVGRMRDGRQQCRRHDPFERAVGRGSGLNASRGKVERRVATLHRICVLLAIEDPPT
jgi:hypothetical protein